MEQSLGQALHHRDVDARRGLAFSAFLSICLLILQAFRRGLNKCEIMKPDKYHGVLEGIK